MLSRTKSGAYNGLSGGRTKGTLGKLVMLQKRHGVSKSLVVF